MLPVKTFYADCTSVIDLNGGRRLSRGVMEKVWHHHIVVRLSHIISILSQSVCLSVCLSPPPPLSPALLSIS